MVVAPYSSKKFPYEHRISIFIDILGFSSEVIRTSKSPQDAWHLIHLLENIAELNTEHKERDTRGWANEIGFHGRRYFSASDSIFVNSKSEFLPADIPHQAILPPDFEFDIFEDLKFHPPFLEFLPLASALRDIAKIQVKLLENGFLSRGGMSIGSVRQHKGIVAGPAITRAVSLESGVCKNFPTVKIEGKDWLDMRDRFERLKIKRNELKRNPPRTHVEGLSWSATDHWLTYSQSEKWERCIDKPFSALCPAKKDVWSFDFISLGDVEKLWTSAGREKALEVTGRALEKVSGIRWWKSKRQRGIIKKWRWVHDRLSKPGY